MELKTFAEDDFDPKKWINRAWSCSGDQEKEVFVANTVSRLQLYMKQLTNSLDETTTQIVNSIPRTLQDASSLQVEGALLQQKLLALEEKVQGVEEQTGHSIMSLQRIDQLKSRLENAASALREADKWAALAAGLEDVLQAGVPGAADALAQLAGQVAALTASLEVLTEAPDYDAKRLQLEALYNRLEAALSAPFLEAITQQDKERSKRYVAVFGGMGRAGAAAGCWRRACAAALGARWAARAPRRLRDLADPAHARHHLDWLTNVVKSESPLDELVRFYTELLQSLEPTPTKVVSASLKLCSDPEEGVALITNLRQDIDEFVACVRAVVDEPAKHKEVVSPATMEEFRLAAHAPLRDLLPSYTDLQKQLLLAYLDDPQLRQEDILEQSRAILAVAERCENWLDIARGRAEKIAGVDAWTYYAPAVEAFFTALSMLISSHGRRVEAQFAGGGGGVLSPASPAALALGRAAAAALDAAAHAHAHAHAHAVPETSSAHAQPPGGVAALRRARDQLSALAKRIVRSPVDIQLEKIPSLDVWSDNDALSSELPDFALSPQEYITEIGQYLMTLPQHLEMQLTEKQAPWQFLSEICTHTCELYAEKILSVRDMDVLGTKRCLTDIEYLASVVEDLGAGVPPALRRLQSRLRAAAPLPAPAPAHADNLQ